MCYRLGGRIGLVLDPTLWGYLCYESPVSIFEDSVPGVTWVNKTPTGILGKSLLLRNYIDVVSKSLGVRCCSVCRALVRGRGARRVSVSRLDRRSFVS